MEKVKVNKELFEALETANEVYSFESMFMLNISGQFSGSLQPLNDFSAKELAEILVKGYELEETPEEKALEYYRKMCPLGTYTRTCVQDILTILDIKIKGINE